MGDVLASYRRPLLFYALATAIPWACWFAAGRVSHLEPSTPERVAAASLLGLVGLLGPCAVVAAMASADPALRADLVRRLGNFSAVKPLYAVTACLLMPTSILLAMAISLPFGYSPQQFAVTGRYTFSSGVFPVWFLLIVAPIVEELAWHSYGTDCLRSRFRLFTASMIFAVFWAVWHAPLASIKDYYQSNLAASGLLATLNFPVSIIPFVLIMNWLYFKSGRNIWVAAVFHITAGYFNEIFATAPNSKLIQTGLLLVVAGVVVVKERNLFFNPSRSI